MRSLKSGVFAFALSGVLGTLAVVGCSADGGGADIQEGTAATDPVPGSSGSVVPPKSDPVDVPDAGKDSGKKDSGSKPETGVDAGPPPPVPGTACTVDGDTKKKSCGACGNQQTLCIDEDGTGKKWSVYDPCEAELVNGCVPGTVVNEACGNCGTLKKTCTQYCAFTSSTCAGEPAMNCKPGVKEYITAGCTTPSTYRNRSCGTACTWSSFTATCATPVNDIVLNIPTTVGGVASRTITFSAAKVASRLSGFSTCPQSSNPSAGNYPYEYIELKNTSATKAAKVTIYASTAPGGVVIDTVMAAYSSALQPMDDTQRKACAYGANDQSDADVDPTGDDDFSILKAVPIPAGGSILVYVASYYATPTGTYVTTGDLNLNVKIEQLN